MPDLDPSLRLPPSSSPRSALVAALVALALVAPAHAPAQERAPLGLSPEGVGSSSSAGPANPAKDPFGELRTRILDRLASPGVAADLYELMELVEDSGSLERTADLLSRVVRSGRAHPEVRALARRQLATVERWRGRLPRMEANLEALGTVSSVTVVGPFDDENGSGYDVAYGPEVELDLSRRYPGLRSEVEWRPLQGLGHTGPIVLREAVRPSEGILAYALTILEAPAEASAVIYLGTPGATKGWLNGKAILADPGAHPAGFDQRAIPVRLKKGANPLLLKLSAGKSGPFELELRVVSEDGFPIRGLKATAPRSGAWSTPEAIPAGRKILGRRPIVDLLEPLARGSASPRALEDLARVLGARRPFDDAEKLHVVAAEKAALAAPERVEVQLLAARYQVEDANRRRFFLERAVAAERPGNAIAHAELAAFRLAQGDSHRAIELLAGWRPHAPEDWRAALVWARALDRRGEQAAASRELDSWLERFPDEPALLRERANLHRRNGQTEDAMRLHRVALAHRPANLSSAFALVSALVDRGAIAEADERLALTARLLPFDLGLLLRRADLLAANGDRKKARALFSEAAAISPQEAEVWSRMGKAELRAGDREAAIAAFERSLELRPQDAQLRELVESLRPGEKGFARRFLHDLREAVASVGDRYAEEDAAKLVDLSVVRVLPSGQASRTVQTIVKVHSQRGVERYRSFQIRHAPGRDVLRIERARVLRPDGSIVDGHTESDHSINEPWSGLYYDARATVVGFPALAAGDTVELVYRLDDVAMDNLLSDYFGDVSFMADVIPTSVWEYVLEMPPGRPIFANETPGAERSQDAAPGGRTLHRWKSSDLPKLVPEPQMPGWSEVAPHLHVSTYRDWDSVGRYWWGLVKDQVQPTPEIERVAKEVVAGIPAKDVAGRVRAVYDFVATKTRYVGLEFGIHSFKPYKVDQVLRRGFGDCKDKASLTYAMLRSLGIESKLVLLRMRHLGSIGSEPASLAIFNHAILYVPTLDLFLDGTAEWSGSRELPEADRGAEILIVDPKGVSEFGRTPEAPADLSATSTTYRVEVDEDGNALLVGNSRVSGLSAAGYRQAYASASGRAASFEKSWARSFPGVRVAHFDLSDPRRLEEDVELAYELLVPGYADVALDGSLTFSPTRSASNLVESFAALSSRRFDVVLRYPWTTSFRYEIALPAGYDFSGLHEPQTIESAFGSARVEWSKEGQMLVVEGEIEVSLARIRAEEYSAFRAFLGRVDAMLSRKVAARPTAR